VDLLVTDPVTGRTTGLARAVRAALAALRRARIPFSVVGATALSVRGLPRMTRDLDLVVRSEAALRALEALRKAGFRSATPLPRDADDLEPMYVLVHRETRVEVDLLVAFGEPERTVIEESERKQVFGASAPVARLEHLLVMYLYSNQPKHIGDFASIVQSGRADLGRAQRLLAEIHAEMLPEMKRRIQEARTPPPAPPRPKAGVRRRK
jgi:hypothetical protein